MSYEISLTDSISTSIMPTTNVPLTTTTLEGAVDVQTLSYDIYTDFITTKRLWQHTWAYMTEDEYNDLQGYYLRQFTTYQYPQLSIADEGVSLVTVRMELAPKKVIDHCGTVQDVTVRFRETRQQDPLGSGYLLLEAGDLLEVGTDEYLGI